MNEKSQWRYLQGVKHERERIIALLEAELEGPADTDVPNEFDPVDWYDGHATGIRDAIALIEGESAQTSMNNPQKLQSEGGNE